VRCVAMYPPTMAGTLFLVPVPIGNQGDITLRALDLLRSVQVVAAEDTRHFQTLQRTHGIRARVISLHEQNERARVPQLLAKLRDGDDVAVVSDAGTPLLSDPGYRLVAAALEAGMPVTSLPGASAITTALGASGLPPVPFRFCGFPPRAAGPRRTFYRDLAGEAATLVCFEAPHRLAESLRDAREELGNRGACLARNLTKPHERYQRGTLDELVEQLAAEEVVRGETTVLVEGAEPHAAPAGEAAGHAAKVLLAEGIAPRTVMAVLTGVFGLPRRRAYELAHRGDGK
jgi:16S rRNA (cytidine1402-2'-O)-methyltransferase